MITWDLEHITTIACYGLQQCSGVSARSSDFGDEEAGFSLSATVRGACSFAVVIQQLPEGLRDPVCVFYLVLRALDTVEDDMAIPQSIKLPLLHTFHEKCYDQ